MMAQKHVRAADHLLQQFDFIGGEGQPRDRHMNSQEHCHLVRSSLNTWRNWGSEWSIWLSSEDRVDYEVTLLWRSRSQNSQTSVLQTSVLHLYHIYFCTAGIALISGKVIRPQPCPLKFIADRKIKQERRISMAALAPFWAVSKPTY